MDSLLSVLTHLNFLHALVGSALVFALSSLYWIRAFKPNLRKSFSTPKWRPLSKAHGQQYASQEPVSKGGAKKLAPVADSVWEWVASCVGNCSIQPVANLGEGLGQENPPNFMINAHKAALDIIEANQYAPTGGLPRFTQALSQEYSPLYGRALDPGKEISVHSGGTEAILCAITAFVEPGDEVIVFEPAFDLYELHTRFVGGTLRSVRLHPPPNADVSISKADEWTLDMKELEDAISEKTRVLVLNTPHNPLGKIFSAEELTNMGNICVKHGVIILSDEVYERLHYTETFPRIATLDSRFARNTVTIGSIGKSFSATGWRVGYAIGDQDLIKHMKAAHITLSFTTAGPAQLAAAFGLEHGKRTTFWEDHKNGMKKKIDSLCEVFQELGLPYVEPSGAHYVLLNAGKVQYPGDYPFPPGILHKTRDWRLCWFLLQEFGVATIPVSASFSNANSHVAADYLRFVACKTQAEIDLAKQRLRGLKKYL